MDDFANSYREEECTYWSINQDNFWQSTMMIGLILLGSTSKGCPLNGRLSIKIYSIFEPISAFPSETIIL